jgi:hypothetical protein
VDCKTCDELLSAYRGTAKLYTAAQERFQGLLGDDFKLAWKELKRLREACKAADEALLVHWRQEHRDFAEIPGLQKRHRRVSDKRFSVSMLF